MQNIKIKMEVDTDPPLGFRAEVKILLQPIPFTVMTLTLSDLFAGKIHALLCSPWLVRVKGRDWYDFIWYITQNVPVSLQYLQQRLVQSEKWDDHQVLSLKHVRSLLMVKIESTDFDNTKQDTLPFIDDPQSVTLWSKQFFEEVLQKLTALM